MKRGDVAHGDSERDLGPALEAAGLGEFDWDAAGDVFVVSPRMSAIMGLPAGPMQAERGEALNHFVHPEDRNVTTTQAEKLGGGDAVLTFENRYLARDGTYRWLQWNAFPVQSEQTIYAAARDVTERKQAKETIARYSRDLTAARAAEAETANRLA